MNGVVRGKPKIRAPRRGLVTANNDADLEETWSLIANALREMHTKNASSLSFEAIYRHAYKLVLRKKGDVFYTRLQNFEKDWLGNTVRIRLLDSLSPNLLVADQSRAVSLSTNERRNMGEKFLKELRAAWEDYQLVMNMATDVFMYLDRVYCKDTQQPPLYAAGMIIFRDCILRTPVSKDGLDMLTVLKNIVLDQVAMERDGDVIDKTFVKACIGMLEGLYESPEEVQEECLYLTSFEEDFLGASRKFYAEEADRMITEADAPSYCRFTKKRLTEEEDRCRSTLSTESAPKIAAVVKDELVQNRLRFVIAMDTGVNHMVDNTRFNDLGLLYELNGLIDPKKEMLTDAIQRRISQLGHVINEAVGDPAQLQELIATDKTDGEARANVNVQTVAAIKWVDEILALKDKYDNVWKGPLQSDSVMQPAITRSLTETINSFGRSSEYISLFIDENMKKGLKDKTEVEVDAVLEKAITLLRYIHDKDMFERYYKKHLCKRLLMAKSISIDVEKQMISRMKIELGNSFTSKLEAMFKDMALSEELTGGFRARFQHSDNGARRPELSISVLTSMTWPLEAMNNSSVESESRMTCIFPSSVEAVKVQFERHYAEKHSGRKLTWMANMGTADIRAVFPKVAGKEGLLGRERKYEINVSTYAMAVLMLFNDIPSGGSLTFDEIQSRTNIGTNELIRALQAVAVAPKFRLLVKEPMSKDVKNTDRFSFNESFQSRYLKFKVGVVSAGNNKVENEKERRETERKNNDSRAFVIEAAIVRIMKQRKELAHQHLILETIHQLTAQFKPDVNMIKQRVESLIEREYLERVENSEPAAYRYLA